MNELQIFCLDGVRQSIVAPLLSEQNDHNKSTVENVSVMKFKLKMRNTKMFVYFLNFIYAGRNIGNHCLKSTAIFVNAGSQITKRYKAIQNSKV